MDRQILQDQIDLAAALYARNHDQAVLDEINRMSGRLAEFRHLETLENALDRCRDEDMRSAKVKIALHELAEVFTDPWAIAQFSKINSGLSLGQNE